MRKANQQWPTDGKAKRQVPVRCQRSRHGFPGALVLQVALTAADPPDPITAIEHLQRAVDLGGDTPDALRLRLAEAFLGQDRLDEAERQFKRILELNPTNARARLGLALTN